MHDGHVQEESAPMTMLPREGSRSKDAVRKSILGVPVRLAAKKTLGEGNAVIRTAVERIQEQGLEFHTMMGMMVMKVLNETTVIRRMS